MTAPRAQTFPSEAAIEVAMRAMRDLLRARIAEVGYDFSDFHPFFTSLRSESDRALPVVAFSFIDEKLRAMLEKVVNPVVVGGASSLFKPFEPLGTASARIKIAAALYWLTPVVYRNLELLRRIRNTFAHDLLAASFASDRVRSLVAEMEPVEKGPWEAEKERMLPWQEAPVRILFHVRCSLTCAQMLMDLATAPYATRMGLPPHAAFVDGYEQWPAPLRAVLTDSLRVMLLVGQCP